MRKPVPSKRGTVRARSDAPRNSKALQQAFSGTVAKSGTRDGTIHESPSGGGTAGKSSGGGWTKTATGKPIRKKSTGKVIREGPAKGSRSGKLARKHYGKS